MIAELDIDTGTGLLRWVSAGDCEPLLLRDGKLVTTLQVDLAAPLGLGHLADPDGVVGLVSVGSEDLQPGDRVLFYTDGVTEARSPAGDFFGPERLVDLLTRHLAGGLSTSETMRRVVRGRCWSISRGSCSMTPGCCCWSGEAAMSSPCSLGDWRPPLHAHRWGVPVWTSRSLL